MAANVLCCQRLRVAASSSYLQQKHVPRVLDEVLERLALLVGPLEAGQLVGGVGA